MKYSQLTVLLPCHSLEDFPLHHVGDDALGLLANWTAMWHPALVASAGKMPGWARVDAPPEEVSARLLLIPSVSDHDLPAGFAARAASEGAVVIRRQHDRAAIIEEALAKLDPRPPLDEQLAVDFLALGYCYLQVQLLTRRMRYASNLDEVYFNNQTVAAASAAVAGDEAKARELLQSCFDVLGQERDHFYPVDAFLMDLTLVAETTIGQSLRNELARGHSMNVMLTGQTLAAMAQREPATLAALRQAVGQGRVCLVGGEFSDAPTAIYDPESLLAELRRGLAAYEAHLGIRPTIYGRRTFGLTPNLPQVLRKLGFVAALHTALDGGELPASGQTKTMWQGLDGTSIDAIARPPLDGGKPETFLNFCIKMGESMDSDHVATLYFAHWPGQTSPLYDEVFRIAARTPALGKLATLEAYFEKTSHGGMHDRFDADQYRPPYLKQAVIRGEANPISSLAEVHRSAVAAQAASALKTLASALTGRCDDAADDAKSEPQAGSGEALPQAAARFAEALPRAAGQPQSGCLAVNPHSFVRRICVPADEMPSLPAIERPIYSAGASHGRKHFIVDVPPMGFAWITPGTGRAARPQKPLVEEGMLRNEYFQARLDETTGALRSLHDYESRSNRLSQQLALRIPAKAGAEEELAGVETGYSVMVADSIEVTGADAAVGEITSRGRLVDRQGRRLAGFVQKFRATRGSRVLRVEIELDPQEEPRADAWNSYYACRFAWADEAADLYRAVGGVRSKTEGRRFESPLYVELDTPKNRTAILTGGLAYHRRVGLRMLDTLLVVQGETARRFALGIGIDLTHPLQDALSLISPPTAVWQQATPPAGPSSGWLFHLDSKNVIATHWAPICEGTKVVGFRVRLMEAYARAAAVTLTALRHASSARKTDFRGGPLAECKVAGDKIQFDMQPCEWAQLEVLW